MCSSTICQYSGNACSSDLKRNSYNHSNSQKGLLTTSFDVCSARALRRLRYYGIPCALHILLGQHFFGVHLSVPTLVILLPSAYFCLIPSVFSSELQGSSHQSFKSVTGCQMILFTLGRKRSIKNDYHRIWCVAMLHTFLAHGFALFCHLKCMFLLFKGRQSQTQQFVAGPLDCMKLLEITFDLL